MRNLSDAAIYRCFQFRRSFTPKKNQSFSPSQLVSPLLPDSVSPTRSSGNDDPKALKSPPRSGDNLADIEWNFAGLIKRNRSLQWTPNTLVTEFPNVALTCKDSSDRDSLSVCQEEDAMWKRRTSSG